MSLKLAFAIMKKFFFHLEDSLSYHNGMMFSTKESDNDMSSSNCAALYGNGWWFNACHYSNLNGIYFKKQISSSAGMMWFNWKHASEYASLKSSLMMIKPK